MPRSIVTCIGIAILGMNVFGQESASRFDALKQALVLSDSQLEQLQRNLSQPVRMNAPTGPPAAGAPAGSFFGGGVTIYTPDGLAVKQNRALRGNDRVDAQRQLLNDSQRTKLDAIGKVLDRWDIAAFAVALGLVTQREWRNTLCSIGLDYRGASSELVLTPYQLDQLMAMQRSSKPLFEQARENDAQLHSLSNDHVPQDSPAAAVLRARMNILRTQVTSVLNTSQNATLVTFETDLELANEAEDLGLFPRRNVGDPLCP